MNDARNDRPEESTGKVVRLGPAGPLANTDPYGTFPGYAGTPPEFDFGVDLLEYWRIAFKRRWLILSILVAFVALGAVRTLMQTPLYMSTVRLQIEYQAAKIVEGGNISNEGGYDYDFLKTQYELIQSRAMAERVASALNLAQDQDFFAPKGASIWGLLTGLIRAAPADEPKGAFKNSDAAGIVLGGVQVRPVPGSRLVDISFSDTNPGRAQRIANAYGEAFIASNLDKRFEANAYAKTFLEDQIKQLKLRLEESEKVSSSSRRKSRSSRSTRSARSPRTISPPPMPRSATLPPSASRTSSCGDSSKGSMPSTCPSF